MTGFGRGKASDNGIQVIVEIKTLNSRYMDLSAKLPSQIYDKELKLKERIQEKIHRGKVNLNVYLNKTKKGEPDITFSPELVKSYGEMLEEIKDEANIIEPIVLRDILNFNDIFIHKPEDTATLQKIWELTCKATDQAIQTVNKMRQEEGGQLKTDLRNLINGINDLLFDIIRLAEKRVPEARDKLNERIHSLISDEKVDPDRLELEIALLADKMDINEEIVRLKSHLKFFLEALESSDSVGRRLNFLCQEINRELNTIGSKSNDSEIAHQVVYAKEKLEQIREQVQNIE
ncbi:MAG: YicC/YloC family endoribonuclease [Balneolaceae bacterium]